MADHPTYHPRDAIHSTVITGIQCTIFGSLIAGVQNTLRKQNVGAMGVLTHSGHIIAVYGP